MKTIHVEKQTILDILITNREKHIATYKEALRGYRLTAIKELEQQLEYAKAGKDFSINFSLTKPVSYEKSYDSAIGMLKMEIRDTVELDEAEYQSYVFDNWSWMGNFRFNTAGYIGIGTDSPGSSVRDIIFAKNECE